MCAVCEQTDVFELLKNSKGATVSPLVTTTTTTVTTTATTNAAAGAATIVTGEFPTNSPLNMCVASPLSAAD